MIVVEWHHHAAHAFDQQRAGRGRNCLPRMPDKSSEIDDAALNFLLARSGLDLTQAQKDELKSVYPGIADMAKRVRQPRGRMAEPAHVYNFTEEDLA